MSNLENEKQGCQALVNVLSFVRYSFFFFSVVTWSNTTTASKLEDYATSFSRNFFFLVVFVVFTTLTAAAMSTNESLHFTFEGKNYMVPRSFVTKEHPGGKAMLLRLVDRDITEAFGKFDHSQDAREMLEEWCVDVTATEKAQLQQRAEARRAEEAEWRWRSTAIAFSVAAVVAAVVLRTSS